MPLLENWKQKARALKTETYALYLAYQDPRVPWAARLIIALVIVQALSPIDLIPDFIPVLGYLDDLIIIPLGITLAVRLIPAEVMKACREEAGQVLKEGLPTNRWAAAVILLVWVLALALLAALLLPLFQDSAASHLMGSWG